MFATINLSINKSKGFSLFEIMMTLIFGLILILWLLSHYLMMQSQQIFQNKSNDVILHAREWINLLHHEIHFAGKIGCTKLKSGFPVYSIYPDLLTEHNQITGKKHEMTVRYQHFSGSVLLKKMNNRSFLEVSIDEKFYPKNIVMISDCQKAEIFKIKKISFSKQSQKIYPELPLHYLFSTYAELGKVHVNRYYLAKNNNQSETLYVEDILHKHYALIDGFTSLSFSYHFKDDKGLFFFADEIKGNANHLVGIDVVAKMKGVRSDEIWHTYESL